MCWWIPTSPPTNLFLKVFLVPVGAELPASCSSYEAKTLWYRHVCLINMYFRSQQVGKQNPDEYSANVRKMPWEKQYKLIRMHVFTRDKISTYVVFITVSTVIIISVQYRNCHLSFWDFVWEIIADFILKLFRLEYCGTSKVFIPLLCFQLIVVAWFDNHPHTYYMSLHFNGFLK